MMKKRTILALVAMLLTFTVVPVMAADSPTGSAVYNVTVNGSTVGTNGSSDIKVDGGSISTSTGTITIGDAVTLTATADDGYSFSNWVITGDYTIVSGSLTSDTITIIPNSDIDVNGEFTEITGVEEEEEETEEAEVEGEEEEGTTTTTTTTDNSTTSPKTGANEVTVALALILLASGSAVVISKRKLSK